MKDPVIYESGDRIAQITLNRPEKKNALNPELIGAIKKALDKAAEDTQVKVIILKAAGDVFSAGADLAHLRALKNYTYEENLADCREMLDLFLKLYTLPKIVIAQVEGHAIAGGTGLISACDFVFAVPEAKFGYTEVRLGFVPALVSVFLLRRVNGGKARELLFTGELIEAEEAQKIGLINYVELSNTMVESVRNFAESLCEKSSAQSMAAIKSLLAENSLSDLTEALFRAAEVNARSRQSDDFIHGISSFLERKEIKW